ncbi:hypothetical protein M1506_02350 [Patescibacteria group bacterium]|nr:hypothetical protein [Patescibacteria group bacterium]
MTINDLKTQITVFRAQVENYNRAISEVPNDYYGEDYKRYRAMVNIHRYQLNRAYGKLEKYINKIGGGIGLTYLTAFDDGQLGTIESAVSSVLQNLDRIIGRLDGMSDKEFENLLADISQSKEDATQGKIAIKDIKNPHRAYWKFVFGDIRKWINKNKIVSTVIAGLAIAYLVYLFGWNK